MRDWRDLDLAPGGRSLVEASAGTGKTWTIGVLYLRLLLEQPVSARQVVVATYTVAAAAELKERLRARLERTRALAVAPAGLSAGTDDDAWLHARWHGRDDVRADDLRRLGVALAELDLAPIGTLHGLCSRILAEQPFAAGTGFRAPALVDASSLTAELADDLWRVVGADDTADDAADVVALRAAARRAGIPAKREALAKLLKALLQPGVVVPDLGDCPPPWDAAWAEPLRRLASEAGLLKGRAALKRLMEAVADACESAGERGALSSRDVELLRHNASNRVGVSEAAKTRSDVIDALDFCSRYLQELESHRRACLARFHAAAQAWAIAQRDRRLAAANQLGFDDLLTTVHRALAPADDGTRALADALFAAWPVALIDEFQDTDPVQYGILDAIWRDGDGALRGQLVLIGDPKQAIYRFRGGDIATYERARATVPEAQRLPLAINRRSSRAMVSAINAFYAIAGRRLGAPTSTTPIEYPDAEPSARLDEVPYRIGDAPAAALMLHAPAADAADAADARRAPGAAPHDADDADDDDADADGLESAALASCAALAASLLDPAAGHRFGNRSLDASDLAVLLPSNAQVQAMVARLRERGIAAVDRSRASVFAGDTARDLLVVLDAAAHPDAPRRVRAALATGLWGTGYHALRALRDGGPAWQAVVQRFHRWHALWAAQGVLALVGELARQVAGTTLQARGGERVLTDLRHLGELLQDHEDRADGMEAVLAWFRDQRDGGDPDEQAGDARALRLESDASCVQVMTLHGCKGLEFGIVLLPLLWKHAGRRHADLPLLGGDDGVRRVVYDDVSAARVEVEEQDERFRVMYVALTRARHACHVWLPPAKAAAKGTAKDAPLAVVAPALAGLPDAVDPTIAAIASAWPRGDAVLAPAAAAATVRTARPLPAPRPGPLPRRHSFTTLAARPRGYEADPFAPAQDEVEAAVDPGALDPSLVAGDARVADGPMAPRAAAPAAARTPHPELAALAGVAGADFGNAVHAILEHRTVGVPLARQLPLVRGKLAEFAVRAREADAATLATRLAQRLQRVLDADLGGVVLGALPAPDLRCEMEFDYVLEAVSPARLRAIAAAAGWPELVPSGLPTLAGLMNGKIDLVFRHDGRFHVLDWKGNQLGRGGDAALEDYAAAALEAKMDATSYRLQALLYTVALERYLKARLGGAYSRAAHLGDSWYVFVRAAGLRLPDGTPVGVWRHRFDDALLDGIQAALAGADAGVPA